MAYAGQAVTIPLGQLGLMPDAAPTDIAQGSLIGATNLILSNGSAQKAPGAYAFNSVALPGGIVGIVDWRPDNTTQRLVAACDNGYLYIDAGIGAREFNTTALNASTLVGLNPNCQFISGGGETPSRAKKLFFISRGQNQVQVLSNGSSTMAAISAPATDWAAGNYPQCGVLHKNHLFLFAGQQAYMSDTGDHENFTSGESGSQLVWPGEGGAITAAFVYKKRLFCFKEDSYGYYLDDSDQDSDLWRWEKITSNFGVSGTNAIAEVLDDLLAGNDTGSITSFAATQSFGDVEAGDALNLAQVEQFFRENSSRTGLDVQHCVYYAARKWLFFTFRSAHYTYNDSLLLIDFNLKQSPRITFWQKGRPQCLALRKDRDNIKKPMYGSTDGKVYFMDYEDRAEGSGVSYRGEFQTPHFDFAFADGSLRNKKKLFDWLAVTYAPEGSHNLSCDYFIDGKYVETITFPMKQYTANQLDTLLLDTDRLAQKNSETSTKPLGGSGRTISFRFYNSGLNESFQVCSITVGFRTSGEQAQKTE